MTIKDLGNGLSELTAPNGVMDIRTNFVYSVVICENENIKYYREITSFVVGG